MRKNWCGWVGGTHSPSPGPSSCSARRDPLNPTRPRGALRAWGGWPSIAVGCTARTAGPQGGTAGGSWRSFSPWHAGRRAAAFTLRIRGGQHSLRASVSPCAGLCHEGSQGPGGGAAVVGPSGQKHLRVRLRPRKQGPTYSGRTQGTRGPAHARPRPTPSASRLTVPRAANPTTQKGR